MPDKKKVLFICMPIADLSEADVQKYLFDTRAIVNIPYGLLSICSYVKENTSKAVEFKIIDINDHLVTEYRSGNTVENGEAYFEAFLEKEVRSFVPDIVGISVMFNVGYPLLDRLAARIKKGAPDSLIVVGGNLATILHEEIALKNNIDAVNYGEGEISLLELIQSEDWYSHLISNDSFVTKESLKTGKKPVNKIVADLDTIPPIDFSLVNLSNFNLPKQKGTVYKKKFDNDLVSRIIYVSRGCPYNCNFCAGFNVHGKKVRFLSIKRVVTDVKRMVKNDGLTELFVCDDSFLFDKSRAKAILREFVKMNIHVNFPALLMRNIDNEIAELISLLGNPFQYTSMESGSEYVLKHIIQKPITIEEARNAVRNLRKYGISVLTNIVIGSPGETDEHRKETLETLVAIGFSWVFFMIALPIPGSRLYKQCKENGYLVNEEFFSPSLTKCNIRTPVYSPEHIEKQAYMMNLHINFINNYNLRIGNYDECITSFTNVLSAYPGHPFAHYGLAKAYEGKGEYDLALEHKTKFVELIKPRSYWKEWVDFFDLPY